jgi:hypothetical protein
VTPDLAPRRFGAGAVIRIQQDRALLCGLRGSKTALPYTKRSRTNQSKGGYMLRISMCVCAFLLLACFVLPMAAQQPTAPPVSGTGTANHITKWLTSTTIGNSGVFETAAGNVGIGTTTPAVKFDVNGLTDVRKTLTLFPSGVSNTLAISGTSFKISSAGKVTFVAGQTFPGAGTVTSVGSGAGLTGGPITTTGTLSIATAGVTNAMLVHPSLTVTAGSGLSGGGTVALGSSATLNNTGVLSVGVSSGITSTSGQNPTLGIDTNVVPELAITNTFTAGQSFFGYVFADSGGDATSLYAYNDSTDASDPALFVENDDSTDAGDLAVDVQGPNFGGECSIDVSGNLFCTGTLGAAVNGQGKKKIGLYTMQSSEDWVEDFGSGALLGGVTTIQLDPRYARTISSQANYHVFLTPAGDCDGLYIANRTATSFEVRELKSGNSSVQFDYRIVAHRKGYDTARLPDVSGKIMGKRVRPTVRQR